MRQRWKYGIQMYLASGNEKGYGIIQNVYALYMIYCIW